MLDERVLKPVADVDVEKTDLAATAQMMDLVHDGWKTPRSACLRF